MRFCRIFVLFGALLALSAAQAEDWVTFPGRDGATIRAMRMKPDGAGPFPAIVALHGCGGLGNTAVRIGARDADWSARLTAAGFVVLFPDSFGSRGLGSQCNVRDRDVRSKDRAEDAFAAAEWLAGQPDVVRSRIGLIGWSNGGTATLSAVRDIRRPNGIDFRQAVAFYPGCRAFNDGRYRTRLPLTILHGLADDWTSAEPCKALPGVNFVGFADAHHDFDHPNLPMRTRKAAFSANGSGIVTVGTHPEARQQAIDRTMAIFKGM